ncbi:hypothetical protein EJ08DRAFT_696107 [Tothia fuscella]|uniref:Zn(2)-C6 fungal-type domain-containing protein n=1 Tax=Tothia fuscella TaxID=1048955 RepID=A0A9P4NTW0_9PEZI|nr:hypothetical protein EJ08DRAFT_696107 [Tothia fuscella]
MHRLPVAIPGQRLAETSTGSAYSSSTVPKNSLKPRSACSRCHAHKLKCPERSTEDESCARCLKAGAPCVFGLSVRGLPQSIVTETGLKTAKDMDMDVISRRRTKRSRQGDAITDPTIRPQPELATFNDTEFLNEPFDAGFDLASHFDPSHIVATNDLADESRVRSLDAEPVHAQYITPSTLHLPTAPFTDLTMDYFGPSGDDLELSLNQQSQNSLQSALGGTSPWETVPQQIASDFAPDHSQIKEGSPSAQQLTRTTEELTKLLLDLHQHAAALAQVITTYGSHPGQGSHEKGHQGNSEKFAVDDTFRLTQTMVNIVEELFTAQPEANNGGPSSRSSVLFASVPLLQGPNVPGHHPGPVATTGQGTERPVRQIVGEPTFHLVISCWLRLGAIYKTIFGHIKNCIETRTTPTTRDGRPVTLPNVRIGNFQMPFATTVTLQMFASLGMGSKLLHCMLSLVNEIEACQRWDRECSPSRIDRDGQPSQQSDVVEVICKDVRYRANVLYQELHATRNILIRSGIV